MGFATLSLGIAMVIASLVQGSGVPAFAASTPYELYCPGTPVGNVVLNDAVTSATLSPPNPTTGQSFSLTGYQTVVNLPSSLAGAAAAVQPNLVGSATTQIDANGATPASTPQGPLDFNVPIPSPVPAAGVSLSLPSTAATVSGFTATSNQITIQEDSAASLTLTVSGAPLSLTCTAYPNDTVTPSGITTSTPSASPIAPVIAVAGGGSTTTTAPAGTTSTTSGTPSTTTPPTALTGAYELYCPGTPVGNVVLNDAVTSATLSPADPTTGQSFSLTGYQTVVNLPSSLAGAAAALQPNLEGSATAQIDASGATPASTPQGPLDFNVPIPSPVPAAGVSLSLPSTAATVSGFTATSNQITIQEDSAASLTLTVSGAPLSLTCTAYPNDTVTPSGITTSTPSASPIAPVIAVAGGGASTTTTSSTPASTTTTTTVSPVTTTTGTVTSTTAVSTTTPTSATTTTSATSATTTTSAASETTPTSTTTTTASPTSTTSTTTTTPVTTSTAQPGTSGTTGTTSAPITAPSGSLAFTGSGLGLKTMTLVGAIVILLGLAMLVLVDIPRRLLRQLAHLRLGHWQNRGSVHARAMAESVGRGIIRRIDWLLGR